MRRTLCLICTLALAGCATQGPRLRGGPGMGMGMARAPLFVSPAGEPFRRGTENQPPIRAWFAGADRDRDNALTWPEFESDFARFFALLDADHGGEIDPAEVARYETEILPEMAGRGFNPGRGRGGGSMGPPPGGGMGRGGMGGGGRSGGRGGGRGGPGMGAGMAMMSGAARFGLLPISHPIMEADANFNRGVTRAEFAEAARRRFAALDSARDGRLTLAGLIAQRLRGRAPGRGQPNEAD